MISALFEEFLELRLNSPVINLYRILLVTGRKYWNTGRGEGVSVQTVKMYGEHTGIPDLCVHFPPFVNIAILSACNEYIYNRVIHAHAHIHAGTGT